ncbi:MAG: Mrp/NBP35 family ATP-binding protein [Pelagibacteraceae bacterium]
MNSEKKVNLSKNFKEKITPKSQFVKKEIKGIKKIIAVSSAKGGVGKSTICANLAIASEKMGNKVGILDADIYGPSIPQLFNVFTKPSSEDGKKLIPIEKQNIKLMSIGFLIDQNSPMVWRGPMVISAIKTFTDNVEWGELDYLFIDMPPGTGDALLTFAQSIKIDGAIIVTTPQILSINDANRGIEMFKKTDVPILGVIENMSYLLDQNKNKEFIFGKKGGETLAKNQGLKFFGEIPIDKTFNKSSNNLIFDSLNQDIKNIFTNFVKEI